VPDARTAGIEEVDRDVALRGGAGAARCQWLAITVAVRSIAPTPRRRLGSVFNGALGAGLR
jgi:hypothetical protein